MKYNTLLTGMMLIALLSVAVVPTHAQTTNAAQIGDVHFATSCSAEARV